MDCNIQKGVVDPSANYVRDMSDKYLSRTWATFLVGIPSVKWGNETLLVKVKVQGSSSISCHSQLAFTCSKSTIEITAQWVKYV